MKQNRKRAYFLDSLYPITFFKSQMLSISNIIFNSRMDTARIRNFFPTGSPVMREMTLLQMQKIQERALEEFFSKSPILTHIPPLSYFASARYLASTAVSISRDLFVVRRPLPCLERIAQTIYSRKVVDRFRTSEYNLRGVIDKLLIFKYPERLHDITVKISDRINLLQKRYDPFSNFLDMVKDDILFKADFEKSLMSGVVRQGYSIWHTLIPVLITNIGVFKTHSEILHPDVLHSIKECLLAWSDLSIIRVSDVFDQIYGYIIRVESTAPDVTESDKIMMEASKIVISRLVIASLTVCILLSASYLTGNDLLVEYSDLYLTPLLELDQKILHYLVYLPIIIPR